MPKTTRAPMPAIDEIKANTPAAIRWRKETHLATLRLAHDRIAQGCTKYGTNAWERSRGSALYLARCASRELWGGPRP